MFIKNALTYSGSNIISQAALFIQGIILRGILAPQLMGIWNLVNVIRGYVQPVSVGIETGASRELSIIHGAQKPNEELRCRSVSITYSIAEMILLGVGVMGYIMLTRKSYQSIELYALLSVPLFLLIGRIYTTYTTFLQSKNLYIPLSQIFVIGSLLLATFLPLGAYLWGVSGVIVAALIAEFLRILIIIYWSRVRNIHAFYLWDKSIWKRLVSQGFSQTLGSYPNTFFMSFDLLWVTKFFGLEALAIYAFSKSLYRNAADVSARIGTVFNTRSLNNFGRGLSTAEIAKEMKRFIQFQLLVFMPLICIGVASLGPLLIRQFVPLYADSIPLLFILLLCSFFICQNNNLNILRVAEKRFWDYGVSNVWGVFTVGGGLIISWFFLKLQTLESVAITTLFGYILYSAQMFLSEGKRIWGLEVSLAIFLKILITAGWLAYLFYSFGDKAPSYPLWTTDLIQSIFVGIKMLVCLLPITLFGIWTSRMGKKLCHATPSLSRT
jgi:O-antigen/teichoic acid export membrane protein